MKATAWRTLVPLCLAVLVACGDNAAPGAAGAGPGGRNDNGATADPAEVGPDVTVDTQTIEDSATARLYLPQPLPTDTAAK